MKVTEEYRQPLKRRRKNKTDDVSTSAEASNSSGPSSSSGAAVSEKASVPAVADKSETAAAVAEVLAAQPAVVQESIDPSFYDTFEGDWCRYCGARDTSGWSRGRWVMKIMHYSLCLRWWQKKTLDLSPWEEQEPTRPIDLSKNTEWKYKQLKLIRERMVAKSADNRQKV